MGTALAAAHLAELCAGAYWLYPGQSEPAAERKKDIAFPENMNYSCVPDFLYNFGPTRSGGHLYDWSNGRMPMANYGTYGGHSHPFAIRRTKYAKSNPEYFALRVDGGRLDGTNVTHPNYKDGHVCFSSPIKEVIYQDAAAFLQGKPATERNVIMPNGKVYWHNQLFSRPFFNIMPNDSRGLYGILNPFEAG